MFCSPSGKKQEMSRKAPTRRKSKQNSLGDDNDASRDILRKIHATGEASEDDIHQMYMLSKPICQGCRTNSKCNPNCFCGLIPPLNGKRKSGIWMKSCEFVSYLGKDVSEDLRNYSKSPAGLTNLGATCYANSILQCLYMNIAFRKGMFSIEVEVLNKHPVLGQLVRLFAQLQCSNLSVIDSEPFIRTLELDNGIQQDSHEFLTLFLSLLESCLSHSNDSGSRTIVQDLYCGSMSHVTRCSKCGKDSEGSQSAETFYDLELNVKGFKNLDESLDDYLTVEELSGDNQYFCDACNMRVDASRYITLKKLPNILTFQLKRYIFLPKSTTKKKITSRFSFPQELNMSCRTHEPHQSEILYDLSAVLIHKGATVNCGHYISHIKDESTGRWWEFDDEHVSDIACHPPIDEPSSLTTSSTGDESSVQVSSGERESSSSSDAYMLVYKRRDDDTRRNLCSGSDGASVTSAVGSSTETGMSLPSHLNVEIDDQNVVRAEACEKYRSLKEKVLEQLTSRRQEVRSVLSDAPVSSLGEPCFWISSDWLWQWADSLSTVPIDNTHIQCEHGKIPPEKIGSMKRLSTGAWSVLFSKYGGGPELSNRDYCMFCLSCLAKSLVLSDRDRDRRASMIVLAESALSGNYLDGKLYYVSRSWLKLWLRGKNTDRACDPNTGPTYAIRCPHNDLLPENAPGAKRVSVPEALWTFLCNSTKSVSHDDGDFCGQFAFTSGTKPCAACSVQCTNEASREDDLREMKLEQRRTHEKLASGKVTSLFLDVLYFLVPSWWLSKWRDFVNSTGQNSLDRPENLGLVVRSLKCDKHSLLLQRPLELARKRGMLFQRVSSSSDRLVMISESDWRGFSREWDCAVADGAVSATIESSDVMGEDSSVSGVLPLNIRTFPQICEACVGERESAELISRLVYSGEEIRVYFARGKDVPKSVLEGSADRRCSKRSRVSGFGHSVVLTVSSSTTLYQLKMQIWESLGIVRENQVVCKGSRELTGESPTLGDAGVFPGDTLWVRDSAVHEYRDITGEVAELAHDRKDEQGGFRGTLLGSIPSPSRHG